jgi:hypothetical protein
MTYQLIENFAAGLDVRKSPLTAPAGTLTRLTNAVVTPGGEIAKRRGFVKVADLPPTSFGLAATESNLYVFGRNVVPAVPSSGVSGVGLIGALVPSADTTRTQTDFDVFDGKIYLATLVPGVGNDHFWDRDGTHNMLAVPEATNKGYYVRTFQSKIYAVAGAQLNFCAVQNPMYWNDDKVPVTNLSKANPAVCTVAAANIGKFSNGMKVTISGTFDSGMTPAAGEHTITNVGSPANTFTLVGVNTTGAAADQTGGVTAVDSTRIGPGFVNLSMVDADSERLTSLEVYYGKLAVFSSEAIQVWAVDADPLQNAFVQLLRGAGTTAARSPLQYGNGDVLFLDKSGVRSMKARDSSNSASVSDLGSPIDTLLAQLTIDTPGYSDYGIALLEPYSGRFWLVLVDRVYVLSYFPSPKITAWSYFTLPFSVQHAVSCGSRLFFRDTANQLWVYGGASGNVYGDSACNVEVRLPYLDGKKPGHKKQFQAFDATLTGTWRVAVSFDFNNPDAEELIGTFTQPTWNAGRSELQGYDSHFSLRFYNDAPDANPATLSNCAAHYEMASAED